MRPSSRGQASLDYVALLALVAVVLAGAAGAVGAPWLAGAVAGEIRHGICIVGGAYCSVEEAKAAGLEPCPIHRRSDAERAGVTAVLHLGRDDALLVERRSDGTAGVTFVDGWRGGAEAGVGLVLASAHGSASARVSAVFNAGRVWEFADWPAARRFLRRFAGEETMTGEARQRLRSLCPGCGAGPEPPPPDARFVEGGAVTELRADLGVPGASVEAKDERLLVAGRRRAGDRTTTYLRLDSETTARLGAVFASLSSARRVEGVLELTSQAGRPVEARVRAAAELAGEAELGGRSLNLSDLAGRLRGAVARDEPASGGTGDGPAVEARVALDLTDPANRQAVEGLLRPGLSPLGWADRARALGRRLDVAGAVDLHVLRTTRDVDGRELGVGAGARFGGGYERVRRTRELLAAWALRAGGPLRRREDCEAAARAAAGRISAR